VPCGHRYIALGRCRIFISQQHQLVEDVRTKFQTVLVLFCGRRRRHVVGLYQARVERRPALLKTETAEIKQLQDEVDR
jgi:hypothetical protein